MKLLAIDMDGTLLDSNNSVSKEQMDFLEELSLTNEYKIVITTGRPLPGVKHLISKKLFKNIYIIGSNGGFIYSSNDGIISQNIFTTSEMKEITEFGINYKVGLVLSDISNYYTNTNKIDDIIEYDASINKLNIVVDDLDTIFLEKNISRIVYFIDPSIQKAISKNIPKSFFSNYNILLSQPYLIDVMPFNTDKFQALKYLSNLLEISIKDIIAIGDGENDITMIEQAGISISMENGIDIIKNKADYITKTNDNNGVKFAIENFIMSNNE